MAVRILNGSHPIALEFRGTHGEFSYQTEHSSGADLPAQEPSLPSAHGWRPPVSPDALGRWCIRPGDRACIPTGVFVGKMEYFTVSDLPTGSSEPNTFRFMYDIQVRPRSGLAKNKGVFSNFGTIDMDYIGNEIHVILFNSGIEDFVVKPGDRIAQLVVGVALQVPGVTVKEQARTSGFGSTGV